MEGTSMSRVAVDKPHSFRVAEKQKSFRGLNLIEKQKSFRVVMEKHVSFGRERNRAKDSPGKRGDTELHLAARSGNVLRVRSLVQACDSTTTTTATTTATLNELLTRSNHDGETVLYAASENGHVSVVSELLRGMDLQTASMAAKNGYDAFHIAAKHGHLNVLKELLQSFPNLAMTTDSRNSTALHTAAMLGHVEIVHLLLETDSDLSKIAKNNGKTALHSAARMGYLEIVKSLLNRDSSSCFRTDKKGQTALHMAVKGQNVEVLSELLKPDPSVINIEDNFGNTALHAAIKKGRIQMVQYLLSVDGIDVNRMNKSGVSPLDIADETRHDEISGILRGAGALQGRARAPNSAKQLKQTVNDIKHGVETQIHETRRTRARVEKIAKKVKKLHISGLNNAINSSTIVAVLIATVAFAAIYTLPGQYTDHGGSPGEARIAWTHAFTVFFVSDSVALFISLAVVVVQTSVVVIEQGAKKRLVFVINRLMWLACLFISIAFLSIAFVVVGSRSRWLAVSATAIGCLIMAATVGSMCYIVVVQRIEDRRVRKFGRRESRSLSLSVSAAVSDPEIPNREFKSIFVV